MQKFSIGLLMGLVFVSALSVVYVRHQHRIQYLHYSNTIAERDALNIEWNQLLTESSTWSFPHRVEKDAVESLSMIVPTEKNTIALGELDLHLADDDLKDSLSRREASNGY